MSNKKPMPSFASIGNLSDVLSNLPLAAPIDFHVDEEQDTTNVNVFDSQQKLETALKLLNLTDPYLVDVLNRSLSQIDTSKIQLKPSHDNKSNNRLNFSPLLQTTLLFNPKLFNGALNDQLIAHQQRNYPNQQNAQINSQHQHIGQLNQNLTMSGSGGSLVNQQQGAFMMNNNNNDHGNLSITNQMSHNSASMSSTSTAPSSSSMSPMIKNNQEAMLMKSPKVILNKVDVEFAMPIQIKSEVNVPMKQEASDIIETKKFYSSKQPNSSSSSSNNFNSSNNNHQDDTKKTPNKDKSNKKSNSSATKNTQLGNWQANLTSQLLLPEDFTPELISQLAAEGYDVVSAGGRKARSKTHHVNQPSLAKTLIDSSDEENEDDEYNPSKIDAKQSSSNQKTKNSANIDEYKKSRFDRNNLVPTDLNDATEHHSFKRFNQILDDLLESYEEDLQQIKLNNLGNKSKKFSKNNEKDEDDGSSSNDEEIPSEYLLSRQICHDLMQESFRLNSLSIMNLIKKENLSKLQNLLYFNIKDSRNSVKLLNEENSGSEQDKLFKELLIEKLLKASDCSIISLAIMTSPKISKELMAEDIIEQIATFVKVNLTEIIFPHYDSVYRTQKSETKPSNAKRKLANQFSNSSTGSSFHNNNSGNNTTSGGLLGKPKNMQNFYNGMREILSLLAELVCLIDLTDTIIITLTSVTIMCFFVENISDIQLISLRILTNIFTRYSKHRPLVFDDILSSLIKLHPTKRNSRLYKCFNGDSIQIFSALILQLIQCEVNVIDNNGFQQKSQMVKLSGPENGENEPDETKSTEYSFEEKESFIINAYEDSSQSAKRFLSLFFSKCKTKQADFDFRPIFENFIQDLLITVNKPEWPVSEIILNLLGIILVNQIQNDQNDVSSRVNSLEYLGQIVSQLRKDSLDYQKNSDKILQVLKKISTTEEDKEINLESLNFNNKDIFNFQKSLITYLDSLTSNDSSLQYSKYFLVGQWLTELNATSMAINSSNQMQDHDQERVQRHALIEESRKRIYNLIEKNAKDYKSLELNTLNLLDLNEALALSKYLCSLKKTLDKSFDIYLTTILRLSGGGSSDLNTPTQVRSKAIKCLSLIIEADPKILLKEKVFACVKSNFLHQTISVREASVDLIGRFITLKPELTSFYYQLLSDRILDVGVSVRKRTIKIFRDVCINQPNFEHMSEICVKILRRINDEDGIKKIVIDMFYSIWFSPITSSSSVSSKDQLMKRVLNIVDVVSEINSLSNYNASLEIFEQLFNSLTSTTTSTGQQIQQNTDEANSNNATNSNTNEQELQLQRVKEVFKSCKQIVNCLIENVLNMENTSTASPQDYKRLVASFSTLHLLSKIKPENFINHAETLLPYLNIKATNPNDNQIINSAAKILECVIPLLQSPSNSFLISLEESLCKLILNSGMMIVSSCVSCLGTVVNKLTKNYKLGADCFLRFFKLYNSLKGKTDLTVNKSSTIYKFNSLINTVIEQNFLLKKLFIKILGSFSHKEPVAKPIEPNVKPLVFRMLFTLGLLAKNFDVESEEFAEYKMCSKKDLFEMYMFFIRSGDADIQLKTLAGLGSFLTRYSEYMITEDIKKLYLHYIKSQNVAFNLKSQVFSNLTDYLNEEDRRNLAKSVELSKNHGSKDDLKEMLDVQSGMASTIIQSYLKPILDSYLTPNLNVRNHVFNCLSIILNQGLVYPIECVPYLIAMTTDDDKKIQARSLVHLTNLQKAHPNFVQSKSIAGINTSFHLQKIIFKSQQQQQPQPKVNDDLITTRTQSDLVIRGFSEQGEILSLNHHLYSLLRPNRSYRRNFSHQLLKMFDDTYSSKTSLAYMLYISDNLAYFPYMLLDEPLYLIHQIDIIISVTGINLLQTFKESLLNHRATSGNTETKQQSQTNLNEQMMDEVDINQDFPIETDELAEGNNALSSNSKLNTTQKKAALQDDDEDESFDTVFNNLPQDLKILKECMYKAQGCCLLLILKMFFKEVYSINDSKIQNYNPNDTAKVNDRPITSRKTNRKFNPKGIIEYMIKSEARKQETSEEDEELRISLVKEYLEFKELILSIDNEENKGDDAKANPNSKAFNPTETSKLTALQQRLFEGIEKTKPTGSSGQDSTGVTPRKPKSSKNKTPSSSVKKPGTKKRKRKKDSDESSGDSDYSDLEDES